MDQKCPSAYWDRRWQLYLLHPQLQSWGGIFSEGGNLVVCEDAQVRQMGDSDGYASVNAFNALSCALENSLKKE